MIKLQLYYILTVMLLKFYCNQYYSNVTLNVELICLGQNLFYFLLNPGTRAKTEDQTGLIIYIEV